MPDNLRDRIAAVLDESLHQQKGIDRPDRFKDWIDNRELADAVMAEVKKELANEYNKGYGDGHEEGWCQGWDANE